MDHVIGISWPRSGHHMLVRLLSLYFGSEFGYCEFHAGHPNIGGIETCCKTVPCKHRDIVTLTKNHDFDFTAPQIPGQKYLIQYRDFVPSVVSNFELFVRNGEEDSEISFRKFASKEFAHYRTFVTKWVTSEFARDQMVLHYMKLIENPAAELARVVGYIAPDEKIDTARIEDAIARVDGEKIERRKVEALRAVGVHQARDIAQFRYYRPSLFDELSRLNLTRAEVTDAFMAVLGRPPSEIRMLRFQCFESREALEAHLRDSEEYRLNRTKQPTQSDSN